MNSSKAQLALYRIRHMHMNDAIYTQMHVESEWAVQAGVQSVLPHFGD